MAAARRAGRPGRCSTPPPCWALRAHVGLVCATRFAVKEVWVVGGLALEEVWTEGLALGEVWAGRLALDEVWVGGLA